MNRTPLRSRSRRLCREARTVEIMIRMHCRATHAPDAATQAAGAPPAAALCPECSALLDYAFERIDACRFGEAKPTCAHCTVHCYRPSMRERIRAAMRYAGPRMTYRHPYLAVRHLLDRKKEPGPGT